jgi:uncharacterized protein
MRLKKNSIPLRYPETYVDQVDEYVLVYIPISKRGITVLNKEAAYVYSFINGKRSFDEIYLRIKEQNLYVRWRDIENICTNFIQAGIIYFATSGFLKNVLSIQPKKLGVWLHITNQCNLRCTYCYVAKTMETMSRDTGKKVMAVLVRDAKKHGFSTITIKLSGGEALMRFDFILWFVRRMRKLSNEAHIATNFVILTNGVLINDAIARVVKQEHIRVSVSLDGLGAFNDNRVFPDKTSSFPYVERGIEILRKYHISFNVSVTITAKNVINIPDLTAWLLQKKIPFAYNFYRENPFVHEQLEGDDELLVTYLRQSYKIIRKKLPPYQIMDSLLDRVSLKKPHRHTCGMGQSYLVIGHAGTLHSCQMTLGKPIGSVDDPDLIVSMRKGNFIACSSVRERGVEGKHPCNTCQWRYICGGGCPLLTYKQKNRYDTNSPYCQVYKELIPEVLRLEALRLIQHGRSLFSLKSST